MTPQFFKPPPTFQLPLSLGGDLFLDIINKTVLVDEDGQPVLDAQGHKQFTEANYPVGSSLQLVIETDDPVTPIEVAATIEGSHARIWADKDVADTVKKGKLWRAVIRYANGLDQVICNGTTIRSDGKG